MSATVQSETLLERLANIVGKPHVLTGDQVSERATHFWNPAPLSALAIVRPADTSQTSAVLAACHAAGQAVVTHGGVTGLVDGDRTGKSDLILSLERQNAIESIDAIGRTMSVQAGTLLQNVQSAAHDAKLQFGLDLGARGSCTVGGNLSTNAGGLSVLRYGMAREQVLGLEVVLADGTVLSSMNRMLKNNAGYDLKQLFIGSEGTLGVITRAVLRLRPATPAINTAMLAFNSFTQLTDTLSHLTESLNNGLNAFEVIWQPFYQLNTDPSRSNTARAPLPDNYPLYAIVETQSAVSDNATERFELALGLALENDSVADAVIAQSEKERANIWHIREQVDIAMQPDIVFVYDISLPIVDMEAYVRSIMNELKQQWPDVTVYVYGHIADGNLHIVVVPPQDDTLTDDQKHQWHERSNDIVYQPLRQLGGSISAEHGIGLAKKPYLHLSRTAEEIALMQLLKRSLDPAGILNPGKIISATSD